MEHHEATKEQLGMLGQSVCGYLFGDFLRVWSLLVGHMSILSMTHDHFMMHDVSSHIKGLEV